MYCGHRNQLFPSSSKCFRPHGHDYRIFMVFQQKPRESLDNLTQVFEEYSVIEDWIQKKLDHRMFVDQKDPLLPYLEKFQNEHGQSLGMVLLPFASSVENICLYLFHQVIEGLGFSNLIQIEVQETRTSTIIYSIGDYEREKYLLENL